MRFSSSPLGTGLVAIGGLSLALALPVEEAAGKVKRADELPPVVSANDRSVLSLALFLEHLETALYSGAHERFSEADFESAGFPKGFRDGVGLIAEVSVAADFCTSGAMLTCSTK